MAKVNIQDGRTCLVWEDMWNGMIPKPNFPELYLYSKKKSITFAEAKSSPNLHSLFYLPLIYGSILPAHATPKPP